MSESRGIRLKRYQQEQVYVPNRGEGFRLKIVAEAATLMPTKVFVHQKRLINATTGATGIDLVNVCSVPDLVTYPEDEPNSTQNPPFFRLDTIDVLCQSQHEADELWAAIEEEVCILVSALDKHDRLILVDTSTCGTLSDDSSVSESIGESISESISESIPG